MKKHMILNTIAATFLLAGLNNAMAHDQHANQQKRLAKANYLDIKGNRIEAKLDRIAARLDARGKHCKAAKLRRKGDRINAKLDRKAARIRQRS